MGKRRDCGRLAVVASSWGLTSCVLQAVLQMEQRKQQQQEQSAPPPPSKPDGQLQFRADAGTALYPAHWV